MCGYSPGSISGAQEMEKFNLDFQIECLFDIFIKYCVFKLKCLFENLKTLIQTMRNGLKFNCCLRAIRAVLVHIRDMKK